MASSHPSKILTLLVIFTVITFVYFLQYAYLQKGAARLSSIDVSRQLSDLQDKLLGINSQEESVLDVLEGLTTKALTLESGVISVQERLDAALKASAKKDEMLQQLEMERQKLEAKNSKPLAGEKRRQVYDVTLINDELDQLEIRLNEVYDVMDIFVLIEASYTFTNKPKKLHYAENELRFRRYRNKILYILVPPMTEEQEKANTHAEMWKYEAFIRTEGLRMALHARKPDEGDWVMMSDLDELPKKDFITQLQQPDLSTELGRKLSEDTPETVGDMFRLSCSFYYYSYEFQISRGWIAPVLMRYRDSDSPIYERKDYRDISVPNWHRRENWMYAGQAMRIERTGYSDIIQDQCTHCTFCFPKLQQVLDKMDAWSHQEYNTEQFRDPKWILDHFRSGVDIFMRSTELLDYIPDNEDVPFYIKQNKERFMYMLKRKGLPNAGFEDIPLDTLLYDPEHPFADPPPPLPPVAQE